MLAILCHSIGLFQWRTIHPKGACNLGGPAQQFRRVGGIDLRAQIFIACRPAGRITLAHCLELLASFRFHILRQNLRSVDNTERTKLQRQLAAVGPTAVFNAPSKLLEVSETAAVALSERLHHDPADRSSAPTPHARPRGRVMSQVGQSRS